MNIHTDVHKKHEPNAVLLFAAVNDEFVWVRHPLRGWEVPGGKVEPGEQPEEALVREAFEEAGIMLADFEWLAEYQIQSGDAQFSRTSGDALYKWVYVGTVQDMRDRPDASEIAEVRLGPLLTPEQLRRDANVSMILKDEMYETLHPLLIRGCSAVDAQPRNCINRRNEPGD